MKLLSKWYKIILFQIYEMYYCILLNTYLYNHKYNEGLNIRICKALESGIVSVALSKYDGTIVFNSCTYTFWNANKYYAWLMSGEIDEYKYDSMRPSIKTMYKLKQAIKNYEKTTATLSTRNINVL